MTIGERLKDWLTSENITIKQFSHALDIQPSSLSHIFSGRNKPSSDMLLKIKKGYPAMDLNWLIAGVDDTTQEDMGVLRAKSDVTSVTKTQIATNSDHLSTVNQLDMKNDQNSIGTKKTIHSPVRLIEIYADGTFISYETKM